MEMLKPFVILGFLNDVAHQVWYMKDISMSEQWVGIYLCFLGRERENPKKLSRCSGWEQEIQKNHCHGSGWEREIQETILDRKF